MKPWIIGIAILLLAGVSGCIDDPIYRARMLYPPTWSEWREDEEYTATLYQKLEAIDELRGVADELSAVDRQAWSATLNRIIAEESVSMLRAAAVDATQYLPLELVREGLTKAQYDESPEVRVAACRAWGARNEPQAVEALATILGTESDLDVQLAAAKALGRHRDPRAVEALGRLLESKDPALQRRAAISLATATGNDYGTDIAAWQRFLRGEPVPPRRPASSLVGLPLPWPLR